MSLHDVTPLVPSTRLASAVQHVREAGERITAQLENVLDSMSDAFYQYDPALRLVRMNRAAREAMRDAGIDVKDAVGRMIWEVFPRLVGSRIGDAINRCAAERIPVTVEDYGPYTARWLEMQFYPTPDGIAAYVRDISARKRAELLQRVLADAATLLSSSFDRDATLAAVGDLVVPTLADWFVIHLFDDANGLVAVVSKHVDDMKRDDITDYYRRYPADDSASAPGAVARSGRSQLYPILTDEMLAAAARDDQHLRSMQTLGTRSAIIVPLVARQRRFGAMSMIVGQSNRRYDEGDLRLAEELARRIALALDNALLLGAARAAADRTARLQTATAAFARALTAEQAAQVVLTQGLATLNASAGVVYLVDESGTNLVATAWDGISTEAFAPWKSLPISSSMLVSDAVRLRMPIYAPDREQALDRYPSAHRPTRLVEQDSWAAIPLIQDGRALGALALGFSARRDFAAEDRALIEAVAHQCAQALERAHLFDSERKARSAAERLQSLTAALSEATSQGAVGEVVMRHGVASLDAYAGVLAMPTGDGRELEIQSSIGYPADACMSAGRRWPLSANMPICEAARAGEAVFVESPDVWGARYLDGHAPKPGPSAAWAAIPIVHGERLGALLWTFDKPHEFDEDEKAQMIAIAHQCSQALDRALLFETERMARTRADDANRAKTEFLAVMSHELRTPLNAIAGYAELLDIGVHGPLTDAQRDSISRIQHSQRHLLSLINDVLNFARIEAGRVELDRRPLSLHESLAPLGTLVAPLVEKKRLHYRYQACERDVIVRADSEKLRQILLNLLSNAIKFTEPEGEIVLSCDCRDREACVSVRDTGPGIPADQFERIFEPFVQLDAGLTRSHDGTGLGLSISRDLARAMGGDLTVESAVGQGSTFTLRLPLHRSTPAVRKSLKAGE